MWKLAFVLRRGTYFVRLTMDVCALSDADVCPLLVGVAPVVIGGEEAVLCAGVHSPGAFAFVILMHVVRVVLTASVVVLCSELISMLHSECARRCARTGRRSALVRLEYVCVLH